MSHVITIANTKGGVGKTTIAGNLAWALATLTEEKTLLVDADPQASATAWFDLAENDDVPFARVQLTTPRVLQTQLPKLRAGWEWIVIDCAPMQGTITSAALLQADLGVIPVQPSPLDLLAYSQLIPLVEQVRAIRAELPLRYVINQLDERTVLGRDVVDSLAETEIEVLDATIHARQAYRRVIAEGRSVVTRSGPARNEVCALASELIKLLRVS